MAEPRLGGWCGYVPGPVELGARDAPSPVLPEARGAGRAATVLVAAALAVLALAGSGCGSSVPTVAVSHPRPASRTDPRTARALLAIATRFNEDYAKNKDGLVYGRWDARSREVISEGAYLARHRECPTAPGPAVVEGATPTSGGYWRVHYAISGIQFVDYWHYVGGRWLFDLPLSNPSAVGLYRLRFAAYARAVGCAAGG